MFPETFGGIHHGCSSAADRNDGIECAKHSGTGVGAAIGAIAGGKKGAAIGAAVGAGGGTGTVLATKGKEVKYDAESKLDFTLDEDVKVTP